MKTTADPGFEGDDGGPDPAVDAVLSEYARDRSLLPEALRALQGSRLLVPVVVMPAEVEKEDTTPGQEKSDDMATVLLTGADGRQALLAFTGIERMHAWNPQARPVPVSAQTAATSAVEEQAAALLVDVAGPVQVEVGGDDLSGFAQGWRLERIGERSGWIRPQDR